MNLKFLSALLTINRIILIFKLIFLSWKLKLSPNSIRGVRAISIEEEKNMQSYKQKQPKQQEKLLVKESRKEVPAKRVNIVSLKMVRDSTIHYQDRHIRSPQDSYNIIRTFLEDADREMFVAMALDVKNQPTNIQVCSIGSLNAAIVHPREIMKMAILSNACALQ